MKKEKEHPLSLVCSETFNGASSRRDLKARGRKELATSSR